jgi:hypothetical protein
MGGLGDMAASDVLRFFGFNQWQGTRDGEVVLQDDSMENFRVAGTYLEMDDGSEEVKRLLWGSIIVISSSIRSNQTRKL